MIMYQSFFGFRVKPFELTPDPSFLYLSPDLNETIATLRYGIIQRRGFVLLIGEPGTGKTTLINSLMDQEGQDTNFAYIFNPDLNFNDLLHSVLIEFDLASIDERPSRNKALHRLKTFVIDQFEKDRNTAIIVDEAQGLDVKTLENLRLLSNLETRRHKLIQIILSGQPQLENTLNHRSLTQLVQRIGLRRRTKPLAEKETSEYIDHRLKVAGFSGQQLFANKARHLIWAYSKGIPRMINIICENSLLAGYANNKTRIDASIVQEAYEDLNAVPLGDFDSSQNGSKDTSADTTVEIYQPTEDQSGDAHEDLQKLSEERDEDVADVVGEIRSKLIPNQTSEPVEKNAGRFRIAWIAAIAGVVIIANIVILYVFVGSFKEFKNEFSLKLETLKEEIQTKANLNNAAPAGNQNEGKQIDKEIDAQKGKSDLKSEAKATTDHSFVESSPDVERANENNSVVVRRGETLSKIIIRVYGREDPGLLNAILKINPDIKNPDLIFEKQIIRLPQNTDVD